MFSFDSLAAIIKNDVRYSGIIINQYDEDIVLDYNVIKAYIQISTLENDKELIKLVDSLTNHEKEAMGERRYSFIKDIYFDGLTIKELEKKYGLSNKEINKSLDKAIIVLKQIALARF